MPSLALANANAIIHALLPGSHGHNDNVKMLILNVVIHNLILWFVACYLSTYYYYY